MPMMSGSRLFAQAMHAYGVSHVFFVPAILMEAMAEMEDLGITRVVTHAEKAAAYMADGYARASRRPGVCLAQHVGAANLAAGLRDAYMACSPVIAVTGGDDATTHYRHAYQQIDDFPIFGPVTKFAAQMDAVQRLPDLLRQCFREATTGTPRPAYLRVPGNEGSLIRRQADMELLAEPRFARFPAFRPAADPFHVERAVELLLAADRPMIVAGGGVAISDAGPELIDLAERLSIPVATALNAKALMPDNHPLNVGVPGTYSRECANGLLAQADTVFFVGSQTGSQVTNNWKVPAAPKAVVQLDIDPAEIGRNYPATAPIVGDAKVALRQLLDAAGTAQVERDSWLGTVRDVVGGWKARTAPLRSSDAVPIHPARICKAIGDVLPPDGILLSDTGHSGIWTGQFVELNLPGQCYLRCAGSLGWALPAAIGAKCALPDKPLVAFNGDGGFLYHVAELETAVRYGVNVVVVVNNNHAYSQEKRLFDAAYGGQQRGRAHDMWVFRELNLARIAEDFGCLGIRVESPADLEPALRHALDAGRPAVVDVVADIDAQAERGWAPEA
ncbi:MAG TPA: thiamine pyrophosphate-binding protein [Chloroflexota bacterium]|nr:thiamine pyrophosphate-binding protein [Chloroflexota bacterium]